MMDTSVLGNIAWHSLVGEHRRFSVGDAEVRRYRDGFPPMAAFADPREATGELLARVFAPGEVAVIPGAGAIHRLWRGWTRLHTGFFRQLVHTARGALALHGMPRLAILRRSHGPQMVELARQASPQTPFAIRSADLGRYYGIFDGEQLVAMAGQRLRAFGLCEISSVCTLSSHRRRGYARALVTRLVQDSRAAGHAPFLHVAVGNTGATALYEALGFEQRHEVGLAVLRRMT